MFAKTKPKRRQVSKKKTSGFFADFNRKPVRRRSKPTPGFNLSPAHVSQERFLQRTRVYVMHNIPFFWLNKFGISDNTTARRQNVSETTPGLVLCLIDPELEYGWKLEQFIHSIYRYQNVHFWTGSGRTEWFIVFSPVVGLLTILAGYLFHFELTWRQHALTFFMPFVWLDGWFWLVVFVATRLVIIFFLILAFCGLVVNYA